MIICEITTKTDEKFTLYDVTEVAENKEWYSIRTRDGYKKNIKKENVTRIKTYNE